MLWDMCNLPIRVKSYASIGKELEIGIALNHCASFFQNLQR